MNPIKTTTGDGPMQENLCRQFLLLYLRAIDIFIALDAALAPDPPSDGLSEAATLLRTPGWPDACAKLREAWVKARLAISTGRKAETTAAERDGLFIVFKGSNPFS